MRSDHLSKHVKTHRKKCQVYDYIRAEVGVDLVCDEDLAISSPDSESSPVFGVPTGPSNLVDDDATSNSNAVSSSSDVGGATSAIQRNIISDPSQTISPVPTSLSQGLPPSTFC